MTAARDEFGSRLKYSRERAGLTLDSIAEATKIKRSLLAALEHNDVSQWPAGIFRRAFVREYARAIGLPAEEILAEFLRVFPDGDQQADTQPAPDSGELRLTLAAEPSRRIPFAVTPACAAVLDLGVVLLAGVVVAALSDWSLWTSSGLVGLAYFPLTAAYLGRSLFGYRLCADARRRRVQQRARHLQDETHHRLRIVSRRSSSPSLIPHNEPAGIEVAAEHRRAASS